MDGGEHQVESCLATRVISLSPGQPLPVLITNTLGATTFKLSMALDREGTVSEALYELIAQSSGLDFAKLRFME